MRFFEFKLPDESSPLFSKIQSELGELVDLAQDLPEDDPIRKQVSDYLEKLKKNTGVTEDPVAAAEDDLIIAIAQAMGGSGATMALLDIQKLKEKVKAQLQKVGQTHQTIGAEQETNKLEKLHNDLDEKTKKVAQRVGKDEQWAISLSGRLHHYKNIGLANKFLDAAINNTAFKDPSLFTKTGVVKGKLENFIIDDLKEIFTNRQAFTNLVKLPFDERGTAPGEALLAMLIPNAKKAAKGDLDINGNIWEVKGAGYKTSGSDNVNWIDSAGINVKGSTLKEKFKAELIKIKKLPKFLSVNDETYNLKDAVNLADFRPNALPFLAAILDSVTPGLQLQLIDSVYSELYPGCKEKISSQYNTFLKTTIHLILDLNASELAKEQAKFSLLEYGFGAYNSPNFIFYNPSYNDILFSNGVMSVDDLINDPQLRVTATVTMKGDKPSPGVFLTSPDVVRRRRK